MVKYTFFVYQVEMAGNPNIPISTISTRRSNTERSIKRFKKDGANSSFKRFLIRNHILKIFTKAPINETSTFVIKRSYVSPSKATNGP